MLYIKTQLNNQFEIRIDLYEDEIFSICPVCEKEHQVEFEILKQLEDWQGSITCGDEQCNKSLKNDEEQS